MTRIDYILGVNGPVNGRPVFFRADDLVHFFEGQTRASARRDFRAVLGAMTRFERAATREALQCLRRFRALPARKRASLMRLFNEAVS